MRERMVCVKQQNCIKCCFIILQEDMLNYILCVLFRIHLHLQPIPPGFTTILGQTVSQDIHSETQRLQPGHAHVSL